tara:strand:- start:52 stop:870 length:819 start_codon:yes stop_codon:yes gene_type:complete
MAEDTSNETQTDASAVKGTTFIALEAIGRYSYGRDLRLKAGDVFVAVDGKPIAWDIDKFDQTLSSYAELPALFTIFRKGEFFEIFADRPLECSYKYASDEEVEAIIEKQTEHEIGPKYDYYGFEALRDMRRRVRLFSTDYSPYATVVPPLWLLYHRMWAPLSVVLATCTVSGLISPVLLMLVYVLLSIYFHKAQTTMMRSYALYLDYNFWFIFAERSTQKAQERLRKFDEKCRFSFTHVPEPVVDEAEEARVAALMREAQAELEAETAAESS